MFGKNFFELSGITVAFLAGIMLVTVTDPGSFGVEYNQRLNWVANYTSKAITELVAIGLILIITSLIYLYQKVKYAIRMRKFSLAVGRSIDNYFLVGHDYYKKLILL